MLDMNPAAPSMDAWMREAEADPQASRIGMYLTHRGVVRATSRAEAREGIASAPVTGMLFSYDTEKALQAVNDAEQLPGIYYVRVWLNTGRLQVGDSIMWVLIGGDVRPRVVDALNYLVGRLKTECVIEQELTGSAL